jgi:fimbrial isopeptide formation D2 family protein
MGLLRGAVAFFCHSERRNSRNRGISALVALMLSLFTLLIGVLVALPVREAVADTSDYGPDGYFSGLEAGARPQINGVAYKVLMGKTGQLESPPSTGGGKAAVSGGYHILAKGSLASVNINEFGSSNPGTGTTASTSVGSGEVLLFADDVMTTPFRFHAHGGDKNWFDTGTGIVEHSTLARVSQELAESNEHYSVFERGRFADARKLEGVCVTLAGCGSGYSSGQKMSNDVYSVFPLTPADRIRYLNSASSKCLGGGYCSNASTGTWSRSATWDNVSWSWVLSYGGGSFGDRVTSSYYGNYQFGLRPAMRMKLDDLLLSGHSGDQSQVLNASDLLRLTYVESGRRLLSLSVPHLEQNPDGDWVLEGLAGSSDLQAQSGLGWKIADPADATKVVASGRTNYDAASESDGNMVVPCAAMTPGKDYDLYVWGQQDGSDVAGWTNRATEPVKGTIRADGGVCSLDIESPPPSFGINLSGITTGTLTAYKIGGYDEVGFTQSGALKSVRLDTPEGLSTVLKTAAETAGGSNVDAGNPIGWVASRWLGYPTDPASDDVTSAFSPYAGSLQLFAKALADRVSADGDAVLGGVQGSLHGLDAPVDSPVTLPVSGPGLYLIVDSSGASLPIIVGTKVFNEVLGGDGGFVDFANAGVKGKPRLGQAALKTTVTDIAKRIVNDAGLDGFDVGSQVEYEIALQVPDLNDFSVPYDAYEFRVEDTADSGLTLPDASGVKVLLDTPSPDTDVTGALPSSSVTVSGQTLTLTGLKTLFADDNGSSGVTNKLPAGSLIRIRYTAVLNKEHATYAVPTSGVVAANMNEAKLTRSHVGAVSEGWTDAGAGAGVESKMVKANAYSFRVELSKRDKDDLSTTLVGARFKVLRDGRPLDFVEVPAAGSGVYRLAVAGDTGVTQSVETVADGKLTVQGVEARELVFEEIAAPSGYFKVSDFTVDVRPIWDADATLVTELAYVTSGSNLAYVSEDGRQVIVLDPAWSLANLPYTGGIGILVLLIVGGLILAFAIRPYILSKRAERDANLV